MRNIFRNILGFCICLSLNPNGLTQTVADNWFFGYNAGLEFSNGSVTFQTGGQTNWSGSVAFSTNQGELLFYGDRTNLYTRNHDPMPNGILPFSTVTPRSMYGPHILPYPATTDSFYLFTYDNPTNGLNNKGEVSYSIIDMNLNGGFGDILPSQKMIPLKDSVCAKFESFEACDGDGYWVILKAYYSTDVFVYRVTSNGIDTIPEVYQGEIIPDISFLAHNEMEVSPDGTKLAIAYRGNDVIEFFDFNSSTGEISDPFHIEIDSLNGQLAGLEFSPSSELLYISSSTSAMTNAYVFQASVSVFDSLSIYSSLDTIYSTFKTWAELQTGPDQKIYLAANDLFLYAIHRPNEVGTACEFDTMAIHLLGASSGGLLPDFTFYQLLNPIGERTICIGDTAFFSYEDSCLLNLEWDFDDPNGTSGSITAMNTFHVFSDTGIYDVTLDIEYSAASKHYENQIRVVPNDLPDVFPDTMTVCDSTLNVDITLVDYLWSIGAESPDIHIDSSGWYSVTVSNPCDTTIDSVYAILKQPLSPFNLADTSLCQGDTLLFNPTFNVETDYNWSTGGTSSSLEISSNLSPDLSPITLWLEASNACGTVSDTATISFLPQPDIGWFSDSVLCDQNAAVVPQPTQQGVDHFMTYTTDDVLNDTLPKPWRIDTHGLYYLHAFNTCDTLVKKAFLSPQQVISAKLGEDTVLCPGDSVVLDAAWPGSTYQWNDVVASDHQTDSSVVAYADDIESEVTYIVTITHPPCQRIASKDISVLPSGCDTFACKFSIPNVFSPNADGINDVLDIDNSCDDLRYSISIYNRWGQLVFAEHQRSLSSVHWDGSINGEPASEGTYYLVIEHGEGMVQRAAITLLN